MTQPRLHLNRDHFGNQMRSKVILLAAGLCMGLLMVASARAQAVGPTYPIMEQDMLEEIIAKLKEKERSGEIARLQQEAIKRSENSIRNPKPVEGLVRTRMPRTYYYDPSVVVNKRIATPDGKVIAEAGQKFNPLTQMGWPQWLVFFDARDPEQVKKADQLIKQAKGQAKPVLVGGSFIDLQKLWQRRVYFDQLGTLTTKFGIKQVPAVVSQEGDRLRIDELAI